MSSTPGGGFGQETDNVAKYQHGGVQARLLARFRRRLLSEASGLAPARVLDAGCGEGMVSSWLRGVLPGAEITGVDGRPEAVAAYRAANPSLHAREGDLDALPFEDGAFDLVVCTEVLEHIPDAPRTLRELTRVSSGHLLLTVPHEPFFRAGNFAAGRYRDRWGSTPGHVHHWSRRGFLRMVAAEAEPLRWLGMTPWQGVVARPRPR
jgi:SAM-dependent methyltransferase